jgi:hypothetical protein
MFKLTKAGPPGQSFAGAVKRDDNGVIRKPRKSHSSTTSF